MGECRNMTTPNQSDYDAAELQRMQEEGASCPIGPISIERFNTGMDEVKRMYALVVTENEVLRQRIEELEGEGA